MAGQSGTKKKQVEKQPGRKKDVSKSTAKKSSSKEGIKKKSSVPEEGIPTSMQDEIILVATLLVCILLFLSYINLCGSVGGWLNKVVFGMIGIFGYLFPFLLFFGVAFGIANKGSRAARRKLICTAAFLVCAAAVWELVGGYNPEQKWLGYFTVSAEKRGGGGIFGGTLVCILCPLFDQIATIIILLVAMIVCAMLFTGKEIFSYLGSLIREKAEERQIAVQEQREEEEPSGKKARIITFEKSKEDWEEEFDFLDKPRKKKDAIRFVDALKARGKLEDGSQAVVQKPQVSELSEEIIEPEEKEAVRTKAVMKTREEITRPEAIIGIREEIARPEAIIGIREEIARPETVMKTREEIAKPEAIMGTREEIAKPEAIMGMREEITTPETIMGTREEITRPETVMKTREEITRPETVMKTREEITRPETVMKTREEIARPEIMMETDPDDIVISGDYLREEPRSFSFYEEELARKFGRRKGREIDDVMSVDEEEQIRLSEQPRTKVMPFVTLDRTAVDRNGNILGDSTELEIDVKEINTNKEEEEISTESDSMDQNNVERQVAFVNIKPYVEKETPLDSQSSENLYSDDRMDFQEVEEAEREDTEESEVEESFFEDLEEEPAGEEKYEFPPIELLAEPKPERGTDENELKETAVKLQKTLESFGVRVTVTNMSCGPTVTQYELQPEQGVKVSQITKLSDDIKLNLAAADIRIEAPIPGKAAVGIEVPNKENTAVILRELLESKEFQEHESNLAFAVGKNISGQVVISDIAKMPHLLIAGATGSGKSVCINTIIMSILYKADPKDVRLIMVDPKVVELSVYNGIPHLLIPVVTDPKKASAALNWAVMEMTDRYKKFADLGVRDLKGYNKKIESFDEPDPMYPKLPQIVIIVDELADLMMVASANEVEDAICRLAQMARAAGLHLIIATQRPSVNVITGVIKANVPSRIAFAVTSAVDSRTILDGVGAERLLGRGDMLFFPSGYSKPVRIQGAFVSDSEVGKVVDFLKDQAMGGVSYNEEVQKRILTASSGDGGANDDRDDYFIEAGRFIIEKEKASIGMLQRVYKIGFNRAARIMDQLTAAGVVGPEEGTKPRKILMTMEEFEEIVENS